jgi:fatty acid desaturase
MRRLCVQGYAQARARVSAALVKAVGEPGECARPMRVVLFILAVILFAAAIAGGIAVSKLLWLLVILALIVFAIGVFTGRIDEP